MKNFVICLSFILLFAGLVQAQKTRTVTGVVVDEILSNKWSAFVIKVGNKKYGVQTDFMASTGDKSDGIKSWRLKTTGKISTGNTVRVYYIKIDSTFEYDGVDTWLKATKIVEISNSKLKKD